jgi:bifunctional UDP-N-acetylglucosamine pyrophosphorylase/glucosamine-1-phosphate N-acetyltransferase
MKLPADDAPVKRANKNAAKPAPSSRAKRSMRSAESARSTSVVILAAGLGKRMKSSRPKVLASLCGRPMVAWVIDQALALRPDRILLVVGHGSDEVEKALVASGQRERVTLVKQEPQLGTGHALQVASKALGNDAGRVVVLYGDMPLLATDSLAKLVRAHEDRASNGMVLLTAWPDDPRGFGRIVRGADGESVRKIVEERDANAEERDIGEVNLGVYCFDARALLDALPRLTNDNKQGEYYLTDVVGMFVDAHLAVAAVELDDEDEAIGVNTLTHLAEARWALQVRILEEHMANGVFIEDPATTYVDHGVTIGVGTRILPCTVIRSGVVIGAGCEVGPFTQLRAGTVLEDGAEVGNFTECKNSTIGAHAKAKHLAYIGDASIGAKTNVGAGTIFANYDGVHKHKSVVGERVFVGSGTVIVAPNTIEDGAITGAGAVVTRNSAVGRGETWVGVPARKLDRKRAQPDADKRARERDADGLVKRIEAFVARNTGLSVEDIEAAFAKELAVSSAAIRGLVKNLASDRSAQRGRAPRAASKKPRTSRKSAS